MKIIIVGGVAGGATAAARLRRLDNNAEILLIERGEFVSFANCGLPYYLGGEISSRDALFVSDIKTIRGKYDIDIRNFSEVTRINKEEKTVEITNLKDGTKYTENYDKLLLSTGSSPFVPNIKGKDAPNVFTLWNIPDTDRIYNYIQDNKPKRALVVGGGFIGIEMAENLRERGLDVTLVEFADQIMPPFDKDMTQVLENHMRTKGVHLMLNTGLASIEKDGRLAVMNDGTEVETDMILLSIGVRPNSKLAVDASIEVGSKGGIIVDERMKTSDDSIYAIGDVIEIYKDWFSLFGTFDKFIAFFKLEDFIHKGSIIDLIHSDLGEGVIRTLNEEKIEIPCQKEGYKRYFNNSNLIIKRRTEKLSKSN